MKSQEELLSQFEDIQDLPISEESLGAFLEGTLSPEQMAEVYDVIGGSDLLQDVTAEVCDIPEDVDVMSVLSPTDGLEYDVVPVEYDSSETEDDVVIVEDDVIVPGSDDFLSDTDSEVMPPSDCHTDDYASIHDDFGSDMYGDNSSMYDDNSANFDF